MQIQAKPRGSSLIIAIGIMSVLLLLSSGVSALILSSFHSTSNIENSNKAYFAAEAGLEEALLDLSQHLSGYEHSVADEEFSNNSDYEWEINYRSGGAIPPAGEGNSPTDSDYNTIRPGETYNFDLFYDSSINDTPQITNLSSGLNFTLYVRTPDKQSLPNDDVFISWSITGVNKDNPGTKYTFVPITDEDETWHYEITGKVINDASDETVLDENNHGQLV